MTKENFALIGTGWGFPPAFSQGGADLKMVSGVEDIRESLHILLSTALQERVMQPTYGCNLDSMLFESVNEHFKTYLKHLVKTAIIYNEPRIKADKIDVQTDEIVEGRVLIEIDYTVRSTNSKFNFVFPFYLKY
jgi:phage baseplate assembly protein W